MFKIALLGAGRIGQIHARNAMAHPELELCSVIDVNSIAAEALAHQTGAAVGTVDKVFDDPAIAGIIIASSTDTHLDYCLRAHAGGKAIFCKKPVDMDLARARAAAEQLRDARLFVGFNRRFDPGFAALKAHLDGGSMGVLETLQISSNDPAPPPVEYIRHSGGMLKDMTIHDFDMACWLLGEPPKEIVAWGGCLVDPAIGEQGDIDTARIMLRTASGKMCVIANSRRSGFGYDQRIEAFCSRGLVRAGNVHETVLETWDEHGKRSSPFSNFFLDRYADAYCAEIGHFADMLARRAEPAISYADGVNALAIAEAAMESLRSGNTTAVCISR